MLEQIAGVEFLDAFSDKGILLVRTDRRAASNVGCPVLGDLALKLPLPLG